MTSLHYTLIALGAVLVVAMVLYNVFQERRSRKQAERLFGIHDEEGGLDRLSLDAPFQPDQMTDGRIEPRIGLGDTDEGSTEAVSLSVDPLPAENKGESAPAWTEEIPAPPPEEPAEAVPPQHHAMEPESPLDGAIEYVARLRYTHPTPLVFAGLLDNLRRISKPIRLIGRREDGSWEQAAVHANRAYDTVELSLLLADRSGPVSEVQLDAFCRRLYEFAAEHGGAVSCQDKASALERGRALDGFCAEVDMLIGLNVVSVSGEDFPGEAVDQLANEAGMAQEGDGSYSLRDDAGRQLFTLANHNELLADSPGAIQGTQSLSLLFDVPRVADGLAAFDRMSAMGFELASRLGGQLMDDGGRPVSRESLAKDRRRLEMIYASMAQHGIPAGGERALRLFA